MTLTEAPTETPPGVAAAPAATHGGEWTWLDGDWRPRHEVPILPARRSAEETVAAYEGAGGPALFRLDAHLERLERRCRDLALPWRTRDTRDLVDAAAEALSLYRFGSGTVSCRVVATGPESHRHLTVSAQRAAAWRRPALGENPGTLFLVTAAGLVTEPGHEGDEVALDTVLRAARDLGLSVWTTAPGSGHGVLTNAREAFAAGPGARVVPLTWSSQGAGRWVRAAEPGPHTRALAARLTALATGAAPDIHHWLTPGPRWQSVLF